MYANISYEMPQDDVNAVRAAIQTIIEKMPFLVSLTEDERKRLYGIGTKSVDFVQEAYNGAVANPGAFPALSVNLPEFSRDTSLYRILDDVLMRFNDLHHKIDSTHFAVGSEAMLTARVVYKHAQIGAKTGVPGMKALAERLSKRFAGQGKVSKGDTPPVKGLLEH